jgi:hypothetical protein
MLYIALIRREIMAKTKSFLSVFMVVAIISASIFMMTKTAAASPLSTVESLDVIVERTSGSLSYPELARLRSDIADADHLTEARSLALKPTEEAIDALRSARSIMPFSEDLRLAETRLSHTRSRIEQAGTPGQVANEFSGLMLAGLDDDEVAKVDVGDAGCNYSTGEIIAIVIGLILGIIPGLILLVVLC